MIIRIFYSWQLSTPKQYNKNFILKCINKAVKKVGKKPEFQEIEFKVLEDVRKEPGSPSVASSITDERIPRCDIFIADLSVVNYLPKFIKFIQKLSGNKYKPFQNNNVINEHGVALNALGKKKIIGVLNNEYGSPNKNPENIPFDLRHLRFPIEYHYSSKTKNKEKVQEDLVNDLTNAIKDTTLFAITHQRDKYKPFKAWVEWEKSIIKEHEFFWNDKIREIKEAINNYTENSRDNPNKSIRVLGLSGLGKTRILFEIFNPKQSENNYPEFSNRVLYLDFSFYPEIYFEGVFDKLENELKNKIIIIDNCPKEKHRHLQQLLKKVNNKTFLITIDSNPEEIEFDKIKDVNYITIKKEDFNSIVNEILNQESSLIGKDNINKVRDFSQGIPLMAVLLIESIKNGEEFIGKLDDKELLDKLLGQKGKQERPRTILKSCSIFNYFGFEDKLISQLEFIATNKNITSLEGNKEVIVHEFFDTCNYYLKREIFEKKGRLIGMRPFPLAIYLAKEWLESCNPRRLLNVINDIAELPPPDREQLTEALAEQMRYLGYDDNAKFIIEQIVGPNSPFDNAEVLNTELGSRLFRSFVEVNPLAISSNITRIFISKTKEELLEIKEGRRNLVWVLEKLCFDKRTFKDSAKVLYSFAVAENENWANNATAQFLQLFNILLPGTEANLSERWDIIEWGLNKSEKDYHTLAIKAMSVGLNYGHFTRMGGAEEQGGKRLIDYNPSEKEIIEYWNKILNKLLLIIKEKNQFSDLASNIISESLKSISNPRHFQLFFQVVKEIADIKNYDWDEGLKGLKFVNRHKKNVITSSQVEQLQKLEEALTKKDFNSRYLKLSKAFHLEDDDSYSSEKLIEKIRNLADEFINKNLSWEDNLPMFYSGEQIFMFHFGHRLYELLKENSDRFEKFITLSLRSIKTISKEERNVNVLGGFINKSNKEVRYRIYKLIYDYEGLSYLLFYLLRLDKEGKNFDNLLFNLIDQNNCSIEYFNELKHGPMLHEYSVKELSEFSNKLFKYDKQGYAIVFSIYFHLIINNKSLKKSLAPIFKKCIYNLGVNTKIRNRIGSYKYTKIISDILEEKSEGDFAVFINNEIIQSISLQENYHLDYEIQNIYESLMINHFYDVWPVLSNALLSVNEDYIKFYGLKNILGSHIGGVGRKVGVLFTGDIEAIFDWCRINKPLAPARLAELVPIFGGSNDNYQEWNSLALKLINEFGNIKEVLINLNANMGTFSWSGSVVPLLEAKKNLFKKLITHELESVANWAKQNIINLDEEIKEERRRDEEFYL